MHLLAEQPSAVHSSWFMYSMQLNLSDWHCLLLANLWKLGNSWQLKTLCKIEARRWSQTLQLCLQFVWWEVLLLFKGQHALALLGVACNV